jgi:hypothetical protein
MPMPSITVFDQSVHAAGLLRGRGAGGLYAVPVIVELMPVVGLARAGMQLTSVRCGRR